MKWSECSELHRAAVVQHLEKTSRLTNSPTHHLLADDEKEAVKALLAAITALGVGATFNVSEKQKQQVYYSLFYAREQMRSLRDQAKSWGLPLVAADWQQTVDAYSAALVELGYTVPALKPEPLQE